MYREHEGQIIHVHRAKCRPLKLIVLTLNDLRAQHAAIIGKASGASTSAATPKGIRVVASRGRVSQANATTSISLTSEHQKPRQAEPTNSGLTSTVGAERQTSAHALPITPKSTWNQITAAIQSDPDWASKLSIEGAIKMLGNPHIRTPNWYQQQAKLKGWPWPPPESK